MDFFSRNKTTFFLELGAGPNSVFYAVAIGFLDQVMRRRHSENKDVFNKVLKAYFTYFPNPSVNGNADRVVQQLTRQMPLSQLVQSFAYTFRQVVVTEVCSNPVNYPEIFIGHDEKITPAAMQDSNVYIDKEESILALANALGLPIELRKVGYLKTLPANFCYNTNLGNLHNIVLEFKNKNCSVRASSSFSNSATSQPISFAKENQNLPSSADILAVMDKQAARIADAIGHAEHQLTTMFAAGELNKEDLLAIYIKNIPKRNYRNHANFDESIRLKVTTRNSNSQDPLVDMLIKSLSFAMGKGQLQTKQVFLQLEEKEHRHTRALG